MHPIAEAGTRPKPPLAARAARSFVAPMTLPPSAGPFAVGDRVNARCERMRTSDALKWFSGVVERKRGNKYDVLYDDGDRDEGGATSPRRLCARKALPTA